MKPQLIQFSKKDLALLKQALYNSMDKYRSDAEVARGLEFGTVSKRDGLSTQLEQLCLETEDLLSRLVDNLETHILAFVRQQ
jgi:hypothetical protein